MHFCFVSIRGEMCEEYLSVSKGDKINCARGECVKNKQTKKKTFMFVNCTVFLARLVTFKVVRVPKVIHFHTTYLLFTVLTAQKHNEFLIYFFFTHWKISPPVTLCLALLFSAKSSAQSSHTLPVYRLLQTQRALIVFMIQLFNRNKCRPCKGCAVKGDSEHTRSFINLLSHTVSLKGRPAERLAGNHNNKR